MSNEEYMTMERRRSSTKETKISIGGLSVPSDHIRGVGGMKLSNVSQNQSYLNV